MTDDNERSSADESYADFVSRSWEGYLRVARLLTGDPHRAEELLQDCLVRLYARWRAVSRRGSPDAYLRRMLVNGNVSWWRRRRRESLVAEPAERIGPSPVSHHDDELRRALLALPRRQRAVMVLRYYADLPEREVAAVLGCSVGAVKTQNSRALHRLRGLLATDSQGVR
ncbi:SigE family RNA polymerase sigma factor [Actinocatenispora rupis]|uniref:DNA-directed RNA polymerase sigma-70 factor n=1 Tax=Actinocatenispora rupis TaxID=519421 RepID=A0A8J3J4M8_9ACTN|nr:SigE family RNA polymerase sigma factor [Actinocatenispora rupis]GID10062.1 DNA-directed RNA polymerase sigma-70 factor [Actinocatenispora rupis]